MKKIASQRSPVTFAAAGEGSRRLSLTPTQPPRQQLSAASQTSSVRKTVEAPTIGYVAPPIEHPSAGQTARDTTPTTTTGGIGARTQDDPNVEALATSGVAVPNEGPSGVDLTTRQCDGTFVRFVVERYRFTDCQLRALLDYVRSLGHRNPSSMTRAAFMMACDVIRLGGGIAPEVTDEEDEGDGVGEGEMEGKDGQEDNHDQEDNQGQEHNQEEEEEEAEEEEAEEEEEEEEEEEAEEDETQGFDNNDFVKGRRFEDDEDGNGGPFHQRLKVSDMGALSRSYSKEDTPRPQVAEDIFSVAPSVAPSTLSKHLRQMGAEITPTESELTGSNYSDNAIEDEYEEDDEDFIGDPEIVDNATSGKKGKAPRPCRELREIARHEGDRHEQSLRALAARFNTSVNQVRHLALVEFKSSRDGGNIWNDFQTWRKLVDPPSKEESSACLF